MEDIHEKHMREGKKRFAKNKEIYTNVFNMTKQESEDDYEQVIRRRLKENPKWVSDSEELWIEALDEINSLQKQLEKEREEVKRLQHHEDTTIGLWCTDRPDLIDDPKKIMFQLTKLTQNQSKDGLH